MAQAAPSLAGTYDFVVVGGGTAGCVLANRLSGDPDVSVLLVEAGGPEGRVGKPGSTEGLSRNASTSADWGHRTVAQEQLGGRSLPYPRGRALGGSSRLGDVVHGSGPRADDDGWSSALGPAWSWHDMLQLFRELERHQPGGAAFLGGMGQGRVAHQRDDGSVIHSIRRAMVEAGQPRWDGVDSDDDEGCGYFDFHPRRTSVSAADALLGPVAHRSNLTILMDAPVERVEVDQGRATGIDVQVAGHRRSVNARLEVILAAGAIGSPCILQRSGIGPGALLQSIGVPVVKDLPVGRNLQDHLQLRAMYHVRGAVPRGATVRAKCVAAAQDIASLWRRRGPSQLGLFARSSGAEPRANVQLNVQQLGAHTCAGAVARCVILVSVCNLSPRSRGSVAITGTGSGQQPDIDPHYLQDGVDRQVAVDGLRLVRHIMKQPAMATCGLREQAPGPQCETEDRLLQAMAGMASAGFDPVGTCRMGLGDDAVVGPDFKVVGIAGLRVADASVLPRIPGGSADPPTAAVALHAAKLVAVEANLRIDAGSMHPFDLFRTAVPQW